ncbi:universal stress protein [Olivibacter sp. XZL3]|uniref:universal stress protein n=1 Tax=Olivibacter sp. XZL3 TaxID=1735116 RepID=UPI001066507E|nr:universal stress protein [Olivibacter sp. XZL3]
MKNILLMVDVSNRKDNVLQYALRSAQQLKSNITLSYILDEKASNYAEVLFDIEKLRDELEYLITPFDYKPIITSLVEKGNFGEATRALVKDQHIDLILMGATEGSNTTGFLFGNKVREIVDSVSCPILLIPERVTFEGIKNILYITDIRYINLKVLNELVHFSERLKVKLSILHVSADGLPPLADEATDALFADAVYSRVGSAITVYKSGKDEQAEALIYELLAEGQQGVVAIANRKYHFFDHLFAATPAEGAAIYKQLPILVMPAK